MSNSAPVRDPQIPMQVKRLNEVLEGLIGAVGQLEDRLQSVRLKQPPVLLTDNIKHLSTANIAPLQQWAPLAEELKAYNARVEETTARLQSILSSLEV